MPTPSATRGMTANGPRAQQPVLPAPPAGALGDSELAARQAIERAPDFGDAWYNLSLTLLKLGRVHDGLVANSRAVALWPQNAQPRHEVIRALILLDERERAAELLRDWLAEDAHNPVARHLLAACGGEAAPDRASDRYVEEVFDGFAASSTPSWKTSVTAPRRW